MKKMMIFLCALLLPVMVNAKDYSVFDMNFNIDDSEFMVLTPDNLNESEYLKDLDVDQSEIKKDFEKKGIYLNAIRQEDLSNYDEYVVTVQDSYFDGNLVDFSDAEATRKLISYKNSITTLYDDGIYNTKNNKFYYLDYKYGVSYRISYITVVNGKVYIISFGKTRKELSAENRNEVKSFIENIKYTNFKSKNAIIASEDSTTTIIMALLVFAIGALIMVLAGKFVLPKKKKNVI